jgi:hypothetical protein
MGRLTGGDGERRRGCRAAAVVLLGHPGPAAGRGSAWFAGNGRRTGRAACSGELDGVIESREEVAWGGAGDGVSLFRKERRLFIDGRGSTGGVQWWPAHGSGRQGSEEGAALAGAAGCGVLHARPGAMGGVGTVWFRGGQGRGPVCSSSSPPCLTAGAWEGVTGDRQQGDRGGPQVLLCGLGRTRKPSSTAI